MSRIAGMGGRQVDEIEHVLSSCDSFKYICGYTNIRNRFQTEGSIEKVICRKRKKARPFAKSQSTEAYISSLWWRVLSFLPFTHSWPI